jgi:hypothetical protein
MPLPDPQPAALPTLSLTEDQTLTALRSFLLGVLPSGTEVVRGQDNLVAEPIGPDFVVMTPLMMPRLGTNEVTYRDNAVVGSIAGTVLTITDVLRGPLEPGMLLLDVAQTIAAGTVVGAPLSGSAVVGGTGTYAVSPSQSVASVTMYAGLRSDLVATELTVQCDVHGPSSTNNSRVIEGLWRSEYACDALAASGFDVAPLYCADPRQVPFVNDSGLVETRWSLDLHMQWNPVIGTPQEFTEEVVVTAVEAATEYTGPVV